MSYTISIASGTGYIRHNNRDFITKNVDKSRIKDNIILCQKEIKKEYDILFSKSVEKFNSKQKDKNRKIDNYLEKIEKSKNGEKPFHEIVFQIGDKNNSHEINEKSIKILSEFYEQFTVEYDKFHVINAVIHNDESTPHLHLDFIPISTNNKRGLEVKNSMRGALNSMGFETIEKSKFKKDIYSKMRRFLTEKCIENNIDVKQLEVDRNHLNLAIYKAMKDIEQERVIDLKNKIDLEQNKNFLSKKKSKIIELQKTEIANINLLVKNTIEENKLLKKQLDFYKENNQKIDNALAYKNKLENEQKINLDLTLNNKNLKQKNEEKDKLIISYEQAYRAYKEDNNKLKNENLTLFQENQNLKNENSVLRRSINFMNEYLNKANIIFTNSFNDFVNSIKNKLDNVDKMLFSYTLKNRFKYKTSKKFRAKADSIDKVKKDVISSSEKANKTFSKVNDLKTRFDKTVKHKKIDEKLTVCLDKFEEDKMLFNDLSDLVKKINLTKEKTQEHNKSQEHLLRF